MSKIELVVYVFAYLFLFWTDWRIGLGVLIVVELAAKSVGVVIKSQLKEHLREYHHKTFDDEE